MELAVQSTPAPAVRKWAALGSLLAGAGTVYKLYFATDVFYVQFQELMHLTHTQIGVALSVAGFISQFGFLVSIYLADRFSKKYMIPTALVGTGITGLYLATMPGWIGFLAAMCVFAVFADMLFWPIMLKTVRLLGGSDQQGRMFGILEAGRGLVDTIVAAGALSVFAWVGQGMAGFKAALVFYAVVVTVIGVAAYFLIEDDPALDVNARGERVGKNRAAWEGRPARRQEPLHLAGGLQRLHGLQRLLGPALLRALPQEHLRPAGGPGGRLRDHQPVRPEDVRRPGWRA